MYGGNKATQNKNIKKAKEYWQDYLLESLSDPEEAAGYLNMALEDGDLNVFLLALQNVVKAQGGVAKLAKKTHKSRNEFGKDIWLF